MNDIETKRFFIDVLNDLREKCNSQTNYNYVKAAGLLRQLLIDTNPLIDIINRDYKEKLIFEVRPERAPSSNKEIGPDGLVYEIFMSVTLMDPGQNDRNVVRLSRSQFFQYKFFNFHGKDITVLEILKLNANKKGGVHLDNQVIKVKDELMVDMANSAINYKGGITSGAYAVQEIGRITLKTLKTLEEKVKADIANYKK